MSGEIVAEDALGGGMMMASRCSSWTRCES
jgi:hypothetical protein